MEAPNTTIAVQRFLDELAVSRDTSADPVIQALLARSVGRLRLLCGQLLYRSYPRLTHAPAYLEADDLLGAVVGRLLRALGEVRPQSVRQFFALANRHIRLELNDLPRRIDQHSSPGAPLTLEPAAPTAPATATSQTTTLVRILTAIDALPDDEREVFECVRIQGMTHVETARLLGVAEKTIQRRLRRSVLLLSESLRDLVPDAALSDPDADPVRGSSRAAQER